MAQNWRELISLYEVSGPVWAFDLFRNGVCFGMSPLFPSTDDAYAWKKAKEPALRGVTMRLRVVKKARRNPTGSDWDKAHAVSPAGDYPTISEVEMRGLLIAHRIVDADARRARKAAGAAESAPVEWRDYATARPSEWAVANSPWAAPPFRPKAGGRRTREVYSRFVKRTRSNPAKKPEDRATRAVRRVQEALQAGVILHFSTNLGTGAAGPWHAAVDDGNKFAIFQDQRTRPREDHYPSAFSAADHLVAFIGVGNAINALKAAGRKNGAPYVNLDTPIRWR